MFFEHVYERGLAQSSYLVGCQATGTAIVIDPKRDIDTYLSIAEREGLEITAVAETHIHADFLSGARELAAATGAELFLSDEGGPDWQYAVPHAGLHDGDEIAVGNVKLRVLHTPGHTPEHLSFVLYDLPAGPEPRMIFTGDFLFVGDLGRPDLLEEAAGVVGSREVGARQMYASLQRISELPDSLLVWPGHGAGSACGKSLGAVPVTTLGFERATNWAFSAADEAAFVQQLLDGQPEPPRYFAQMKRLNKDRPASSVLPTMQSVPQWSAEELIAAGASGRDDLQIVDLRDGEESLANPVPGAFTIPMDGGVSTWFGWLLAYDRDIAIVCRPEDRGFVQRALARIGLDRLIGWADEQAVSAALSDVDGRLPVRTVSVDEAVGLRSDGALVLDVRGRSEYDEAHIDGALNIHLGHLERRAAEIPAGSTIITHCQGGYRSTIACSVLRRLGFDSVVNLAGGFEAWQAAADRTSVAVG